MKKGAHSDALPGAEVYFLPVQVMAPASSLHWRMLLGRAGAGAPGRAKGVLPMIGLLFAITAFALPACAAALLIGVVERRHWRSADRFLLQEHAQ